MIDTASAKELLQSTDVEKLQLVVKEHQDYLAGVGSNMDGALHLQILKLLILLQNRILQLQTADSSFDRSEIAVTYAGMAHFWNLMYDGEKCQGQLKKAFSYDIDCVEALTLQSELHSNCNRFIEATADIRRIISILKARKAPRDQLAQANVKLSTVYEMMGNFDDAISVLKVFIEENKMDINSTDKDEQRLIIEVYGRVGILQEKTDLNGDAVKSLSVAVSALNSCYGSLHSKTQEMEYLLEMACSAQAGDPIK
jgi:tetratricopeptide (TPR) repeat protein